MTSLPLHTARSDDASDTPTTAGLPCTRRQMLGCLGAITGIAALYGCSSTTVAGPGDMAEAVTVSGSLITLRLDRIDGLRTVNTAYVIGTQSTIVLRLGEREYRAFTNVCTHAGCGISTFTAPRMICQCHGSEYNIDGINVAGPAPLPLTRYPAELDTAGTTLRITKVG